MSPSRPILLALLTCFACPAAPPLEAPAEPLPDAGPTDGGLTAPPTTGLDSGVVFLDWVGERGAPLVPVVDAELPGQPFAVSATTYALESDCDAGACTYSWYTNSGALLRRHTHLVPASTNPFSNDGTKFAAIEVTDRFDCAANGTSLPLVEGTFGLYDGLTGTRLFSHGPMVGDPGLITNTFTQHGTIVRLDRSDRATCQPQESAPLLATAPFSRPEVLDAIPSEPGFPPYVEDDTADGQLVISTRSGLNTPLGLARPRDPASFRQLDRDHQLSRQSGGFLHVLGGWPYSRVSSVHLAPGLRFDTSLPSMEADFTSLVISHRWVMSCAQGSTPAEKRCDAIDGLGVRPRRSTSSGPALPAVAGALETAVYRTADGGVERLDLVSGARSTLDVPATTVRAVGNGTGFLLNDATRAWGAVEGSSLSPRGAAARALSRRRERRAATVRHRVHRVVERERQSHVPRRVEREGGQAGPRVGAAELQPALQRALHCRHPVRGAGLPAQPRAQRGLGVTARALHSLHDVRASSAAAPRGLRDAERSLVPTASPRRAGARPVQPAAGVTWW